MAKTGLMGGGIDQPSFGDRLRETFSRGENGILPERGSQRQLDAVNALTQAATSMAGQSNSPLLAFATPMIGGAVRARTNDLYKTAQEGRDAEATGALLEAMGGGGAAQAAQPPMPSTQVTQPSTQAQPAGINPRQHPNPAMMRLFQAMMGGFNG